MHKAEQINGRIRVEIKGNIQERVIKENLTENRLLNEY